jgi:hypothetical protein
VKAEVLAFIVQAQIVTYVCIEAALVRCRQTKSKPTAAVLQDILTSWRAVSEAIRRLINHPVVKRPYSERSNNLDLIPPV